MSKKILIVDDSATDRLIIKKMLTKYSILTANDGLEAMHIINKHTDIDLIILDLNMPNMDGFEVLDKLRSDNRYKRLRTIILTNYDELENEIKGLKLGAVDYIRKPINMNSLKVRIDIHINLLEMQQLVEDKLHEHKLTFDTIFHQAPIGIAISHESGLDNTTNNSTLIVNKMFEQITGRTIAELNELGLIKIAHPDDVKKEEENFKKLQSGEISSFSMEKRFIKPDGSIVWVYMVIAPLYILDGNYFNHICLIQDITERMDTEKALSESERSKSVLLSHLPGLAYRCNYDIEWTMQYVSDGCLELTGYTPNSILFNRELSYNEVIAPEYRELLRMEWAQVLAKKQTFRFEYEIITAQGDRKWVLELGEGVYNDHGNVEALEGIILDISNRKEFENTLKYNNDHDEWTGLYNRRYLVKLLEHDANSKMKHKRALVAVNLSTVHFITMTYGFQYTQELLKKVADALIIICTDTCLLFKAHENQFVFYIVGYKDKNELRVFCESIADILISILVIERVSGSLGIVEITEKNRLDADQLLKDLLIASEKAATMIDKEFGYCFYDLEMETQILREETLKRELAQIATDVNDGRFYLQYQPILDLKSNLICGFEALARLTSNTLGPISPIEFIPIAEETKLIIPLGEIIILKALNFLNVLKRSGYSTLSISINISATQLLRTGFVENLFSIINRVQVDPRKIELELTESIFASNYKDINNILEMLESAGIKVALDDFGTGYSSLARERELKVDCLKIDKAFIDKLSLLKEEDAITGDIISMAHKLGHCVVAEGVEHQKQRRYLKEHGCDKIQGYLISKPLDEEAAIDILRKQNDDIYSYE